MFFGNKSLGDNVPISPEHPMTIGAVLSHYHKCKDDKFYRSTLSGWKNLSIPTNNLTIIVKFQSTISVINDFHPRSNLQEMPIQNENIRMID